MGRNSKERQKNYIENIRGLIVRKPNIGIYEIQDILDEKNLHLDKNTIAKYVKKIYTERTKRLNYRTVNYVLADFADEVAQVKQRLWAIAQNAGTEPKSKVSALVGIVKASESMIDRMFDAGVFERQLGKLKTESRISPENEDAIRQAIQYVFEPDNPKKIRGVDFNGQLVEGKISGE